MGHHQTSLKSYENGVGFGAYLVQLQTEFNSSQHRKQELDRFLNFYNTVKPHSALVKKDEQQGRKQILTPYEWLKLYFNQSANNA